MEDARWDLFFRLGMEAYNRGDWPQAVEAFGVALEEARLQPEPDLRLARSLNNLACALGHLGRQSESIGLQEEALQLTRHLLGDHHELVAGGFLNLASDYARVQRYQEAEVLFEKALECLDRTDSRTLRLQALENFSQFYLAQQKLPEASGILRQLLTLQQGDEEARARLLHSLTHIYDALGEEALADESREETLLLIEKLWGPENLAYAEVVGNLAESLMAQNRPQEATKCFEKASRAFAACVPFEDPRRIGAQLGQLLCLRESGNLLEAARLGAEVLGNWPEGHPELGRWLNEVGLVAFLAKDYPQAADYFARSLECSGQLPISTRISVSFNLGSAWMGAGDHTRAMQTLETCADLAEEHLAADHQMTQRIWLQLQELYRLTDQPQKESAIQQKLERSTTPS